MDFLKDKREISEGNSPPGQALTPNTTTIGPIATSRTSPKRKVKGRLKRTAAGCRRVLRIRPTRPPSQSIRRHASRWSIQMRLKTCTGQLPVSSMTCASLINSGRRLDDNVTRTGKVATICDIGAVTCVQPSTKSFRWLTGGPQL